MAASGLSLYLVYKDAQQVVSKKKQWKSFTRWMELWMLNVLAVQSSLSWWDHADYIDEVLLLPAGMRDNVNKASFRQLSDPWYFVKPSRLAQNTDNLGCRKSDLCITLNSSDHDMGPYR